MSSIRLKIQVDSDSLEFVKDIDVKFWLFLDLHQFKKIEALKREIMTRIFIAKTASNRNKKQSSFGHLKFTSIKLTLDNYEMPADESSSLLRDLDTIV